MAAFRRTIGTMLLGMAFVVLAGATLFAGDQPQPGAVDAATLGVVFVEGSTNSVMLERDGKRYLVDLSTRSVHEVGDPAPPAPPRQASQSSSAAARTQAQAEPQPAPAIHYYRPGDDRLFFLPTGKRLERHGLLVSFTHRFPYEAAFSGVARGHTLAGLDDFSASAFGFTFGITSRLSVSAYRAPSIIGRPLELMAGYELAEERTGAPLNASVRFSVDGQNDFSRNFTTNFEAILSRSFGPRAALYLVPTVSLHNRPVLAATSLLTNPPAFQPCGQGLANDIPASLHVRPCANTFALGVGLAVDVRPTVALIAEVDPTLANGEDLGIHRPPFSFAIQKKIWRHAFTFGFTTSPGTTVAQRSGTRATFLRDPHADTPSGLFVGFNLSRQLR